MVLPLTTSVAVDRHIALEAAVHGVVLEHVCQVVRLEQVVDADDLDVVAESSAPLRGTRMRPMRPKPLMPTLMAMESPGGWFVGKPAFYRIVRGSPGRRN
jgi:hypothetical protein